MNPSLNNYLKNNLRAILKQPALFLYVISSFIFIISFYMHWEVMTLISRSVIVPSILIHYLQKSNDQIEKIVVLVCCLFFIGDIIIQTRIENSLKWIIIIYISSYTTLFLYLAYEIWNTKFKKIIKKQIYTIILIFVVYLSVLFQFLNIIFDSPLEYKNLYAICSIILFILLILVSTNFYLTKDDVNIYLIICIFMFLISDTLHTFRVYYVERFMLDFFGVIFQTLSHYFLIQYFILKQRQINNHIA